MATHAWMSELHTQSPERGDLADQSTCQSMVRTSNCAAEPHDARNVECPAGLTFLSDTKSIVRLNCRRSHYAAAEGPLL